MSVEPHRKLRTPLLFQDLASAEELQELLNRAEIAHYAQKQLIFREGDPSDKLFVIIDGCVEIRRERGAVHLDEQSAGEYFGELGLFDNSPRSASATAKSQTTCHVLSYVLLNLWLETHPRVAISFLRHATRRIRDLSAELRSSRTRTYERVADYIQRRLVQEGEVRIVKDMPSNTHLAQQFNISRRHIINIMNSLREGDYIELHGRNLILKRDLPPTY